MSMKITLASLSSEMISCWEKEFSDLPNVEIYNGSILDVTNHAIVSPANSFGFMDGGLDLKISEYFNYDVQKRVQAKIMSHHYGELTVGTALIIETYHPKTPYLIVSPTMRVPMELGDNNINVYLSTRAALLLTLYGKFDDGTSVAKKVTTITFSAMGTGVGKLSPRLCALQMRKAYDAAQNQTVIAETWMEAKQQHLSLLGK